MTRMSLVVLLAAFPALGAELSEVRMSTGSTIPRSRSVFEQKYDGAKKNLNALERVQKAVLDKDWQIGRASCRERV